VLVDSGAFSAHTVGQVINVSEFAAFAETWRVRADAIACLDSIAGDWRVGWANMEAMPKGLGFPTFHDSDPDELLPDLCAAAHERGGWLGIGLLPETRHVRADWLRQTLERIPSGLHVHGWALRRYWNTHRRLDSVDSTNWHRDAQKVIDAFSWLTPAESVAIVVKRYQRERRQLPRIDAADLYDNAIDSVH
jgi:hypothetical protein